MFEKCPSRARVSRLALAALMIAFAGAVGSPARSAVPAEVENVGWCPGTTDCLSWSSVPGATGYRVYRGSGDSLAELMDGDVDSCLLGSFAASTTGPSVADVSPGEADWFLVTAWNAEGEGSPGLATPGPRVVNSIGECVAGGGLVLNEVDYDQPGTDGAEFVEIHNSSSTTRDLTGLVLVLVNGGTSLEYERVNLSDAGISLAPGAYLVVGSPAVVSTLPPGALSVAFSGSTNNIQNGGPDGVALFDTVTETLLDAISYEGSIHDAQLDGVPGTHDLVEGSPTSAADSNSVSGSLARFPDGSDSNDAATDWVFNNLPSPGTENPIP